MTLKSIDSGLYWTHQKSYPFFCINFNLKCIILTLTQTAFRIVLEANDSHKIMFFFVFVSHHALTWTKAKTDSSLQAPQLPSRPGGTASAAVNPDLCVFLGPHLSLISLPGCDRKESVNTTSRKGAGSQQITRSRPVGHFPAMRCSYLEVVA